jgi:steroid Delta-isomerase
MKTHDDPRVQGVIDFFESLTPGSVPHFGRYYTDDCHFKDPFNEVRGLAEVQRIFRHMDVALREPRFVVTAAVAQGDQCFLTWDFRFRFRRYSDAPQVVRGASHLVFAPDGRIAVHRDYWDAAEELYEKLPVVKVLMRWLKRRANA